jgi:hypothetical protein
VLRQFDVVDPSGTTNDTQAFGIDDAAVVVGSWGSGGNGFIWDSKANKFTSFHFVDPLTKATAVFTKPYAINNLGTIVGNYGDGTQHAAQFSFLLDASGFHQLPVTFADLDLGISDSGTIVGTNWATYDGGIVLSNGAVTSISFPGAARTFVNGISANSGLIVGHYQAELGGAAHGFVVGNGQFVTVDVPGVTSTVVVGVNNAGVLVGFATVGGIDSAIQRMFGFVATPH